MATGDSNVSPLVRRGSILLPDVIVEYELWQPSPDQWVTIGRVRPTDDASSKVPNLIVGTGSNELEAVHDLFERLQGAIPPHTQHVSVSGRKCKVTSDG